MNHVHVGQQLGTANKVTRVYHLKTWGWIARDSTGSEYAQVQPRGADPYARIILHDGLGGLPWPPQPPKLARKQSGDNQEKDTDTNGMGQHPSRHPHG